MNESKGSKRLPASALSWFLWAVGTVSQLAFGAAIMPAKWIREITDELGLAAFPETPLAYYLARHLSLLYGFIGIALIVISYRLTEYRSAVRFLALGTIAFGVLQGVADHQSGMPLWWTVGESASTMMGGTLMLWLDRNCEDS